jgi:membrane-bound lytic murein transglycosylase B
VGDYARSAAALADIPGKYLHWIQDAGAQYGLEWTVIAGIYSVESEFGRSNLAGGSFGENSAGAGGPGQFLSGTSDRYGTDGDGDGIARVPTSDRCPTPARR